MASVDDLWLVDFGQPQRGEPALIRPALILGPPTTFDASFPFVLVAPLTTAQRGLDLHVEIEANAQSGLDATSYVQCEQLRSVDVRRLLHRLGVAEPLDASRARSIVRTLLGL